MEVNTRPLAMAQIRRSLKKKQVAPIILDIMICRDRIVCQELRAAKRQCPQRRTATNCTTDSSRKLLMGLLMPFKPLLRKSEKKSMCKMIIHIVVENNVFFSSSPTFTFVIRISFFMCAHNIHGQHFQGQKDTCLGRLIILMMMISCCFVIIIIIIIFQGAIILLQLCSDNTNSKHFSTLHTYLVISLTTQQYRLSGDQ